MSQDIQPGASHTDLAPEASTSPEAVPPYDLAERRSLMLTQLRALRLNIGEASAIRLVRLFTSGKAADIDDPFVEVVIETIRLVNLKVQESGFDCDTASRINMKPMIDEMSKKAMETVRAQNGRFTLNEKINMFLTSHGSDAAAQVSWNVNNSRDYSEIPNGDIAKVITVLDETDKWITEQHVAGNTPTIRDIGSFAGVMFQTLCVNEVAPPVFSGRDEMYKAAGDLRDILDNDNLMSVVLGGIGYNHGNEVPDDQVERVTGIFNRICATVSEAGYTPNLNELAMIIDQEIEQSLPADSKSEAPTSAETDTTLEGRIADTTTAEAIGDMSSEHVQQAIEAEMEQAAHEHQMARIQLMINIGVGVVMSEVGTTSIRITHDKLAAFSATHEVVTEPLEDGGYTISLMRRDSEEYARYVASQMEGISAATGIPAVETATNPSSETAAPLVNPGEM